MQPTTATVSQIAEIAATRLATGNTADYKLVIDLMELAGNGALISYSATGEDGEPELRDNLVYKDSNGDWHHVLVIRHIGRECTDPSNDWEYTHWHDSYPVNDLAPAPAPAPVVIEPVLVEPVPVTTNSHLVKPTRPIVNTQSYIINRVLLIIDYVLLIFLLSFLIINFEGYPLPWIRGPPVRHSVTTGTSHTQ